MRRILFFCFLILIAFFGKAQLNNVEFNKVDSLQNVESKHHIVLITADWCKYCKKFEQKVLENQKIQKELNSEFYFSILNAENKEDITYNNRTFKLIPNGVKTGEHELARSLGTVEGILSFPTIVVLNNKYEIIYKYNKLMNKKEFTTLLKSLKYN